LKAAVVAERSAYRLAEPIVVCLEMVIVKFEARALRGIGHYAIRVVVEMRPKAGSPPAG
jgi:hypothetical protein